MDLTSTPFVVGKWTVDPLARELRHIDNDKTVGIEPKLIKVLWFFALNAGDVVSAEEIIAAAWGPHHVGETPIPNAISRLRKLLGDTAERPFYIQTIHGEGYRLVCPVQLELDATVEPEANAHSSAHDAPAPSGVGDRGEPPDEYLAFICYHRESNSDTARWLIERLNRAQPSSWAGKKKFFLDEEQVGAGGIVKSHLISPLKSSDYLVICMSTDARRSDFILWELKEFLKHSNPEHVLLARVGNHPDDWGDLQDRDFIPQPLRDASADKLLPIVDLRGDPAQWKDTVLKDRKAAVDRLLTPMLGFSSLGNFRQSRIAAWWRTWGLLAAGLLAMAVLLFQRMPTAPVAIAAVPFENIANPDDDIPGRGLARDVLTYLKDVEHFNVISAAVSFPQLNKRLDVLELAKRIDTDYILDGTINIQPNGITVHVVVTDANTGLLKASGEFHASPGDLNTLGPEIAVAVADWLVTGKPFRRATKTIKPATASAEANRLYYFGVEFLRRTNEESNLRRAIDMFDQALAQDARYAAALAGSCEANLRLYIVKRDTALYETAEKRCNRALTLQPGLQEARVSIGTLYREAGKLFESEEILRAVLAQDPENVDVLIELAETYADSDRLDKAETTLRTAVDLQPGYWESYSALGHFLYQQSKYEEALENFLLMEQLMPDSAIAQANIGSAYYALNDTERAKQALDKSIELEPMGFTQISRGLIAYYDGEYSVAADAYEQGIALGEEDYWVWGLFAEASRLVEARAATVVSSLERAARLAQERVNIKPTDTHALAQLGLFQARLGNSEAAHENIAKAHKLSPDDVDIHHIEAAVWAEEANTGEVCRSLRRALARGFDRRSIENDPDFQPHLSPSCL